MSTEVVVTLSDDSSCELPAVELFGTASVRSQSNFSIRNERTIDIHIEQDCVDLTEEVYNRPTTSQTNGCTGSEVRRPSYAHMMSPPRLIDDDDYEMIDTGWSASSVAETYNTASPSKDTQFNGIDKKFKADHGNDLSADSDSTVELDTDVMFDRMFPSAVPLSSATVSSATADSSASTSAQSSGSVLTSVTSTTSLTSTGSSQKESGAAVPRRQANGGTREERQNKKLRVEAERAERRVQAELQKAYRPGECMQHMRVEMDQTLRDAWYASDIPRELTAARAAIITIPSSSVVDPRLITFARDINGQLERSDHALLVVEAKEVAELVSRHELAQHVGHIAAATLKTLTLVVLASRAYFKEKGRKKRDGLVKMTEVELEMATADLLVSAGADAACVETANELALLVTHMTKAVAEQPYKKRKYESDSRAEFYMRGDNRQCVTVDTDGNGLGQLWQQMIAVLPQSSLETARALCAAYPSPLSLRQEASEEGGRGRVAGVGVFRAAVPDARARALGPEFARRITTFLTADCGDTLLT